MTNVRSLITLLLLAALIPVAWVGTANWRGTLQPDPAPAPAPAAPMSAVRPQLGRAAHSLSVKPPRNAQDEPSASAAAIPTAEEQPSRAEAAPRSAFRSVLAMILPDPAPPIVDKAPRSELSLGGSVAIPGSPAQSGSTPAAAIQGTAWDPLAVVEFVALTQDQQLLQRDDFWAPSVRELKIKVWWNVAGTQTQRLELFGPDGTLYRRFSTAFDADALPRTQGLVLVETPLPVGGTWITEYSLFGAWRVDVYLGGQSKPITSASFLLNS